MNGTPVRRGPGGFPATPQTNRPAGPDSAKASTSTPSRPNVRSPLPDVPRSTQQSGTGPLISTDIVDAAQQRFYVFAAYVALWAWRSWDFYTLAADDTESFWLFLKWAFIDCSFMFGVPLLGIPWLEWSNAAAFLLFALHAIVDFMLMRRVGVPLQAWAVSLVAFMWDSELAISERSVKPGAILHNASLILGKQIVNILPEGSAILNPNKDHFCLNSSVTHLEIPIQINQTEPIEIELLRIDIDNNHNETIILKRKELNNLLKKAKKSIKALDPADPLILRYTVKKTGVYFLQRVIDHSRLEVRPRTSSAVIATCPRALVKPTGKNRCRNDLSDVALEIEGIPPLSLKYRKSVGGRSQEATELQGIQPDGYTSPLSRHTSQALIHGTREDVSWAQSQKVVVSLNETLIHSGIWEYAVEEVSDALGNIVNYVGLDDEERPKQKAIAIQALNVHERPTASLEECNPQHPLQVAKGHVKRLPIKYGSTGRGSIDTPHTVEYLFTPEADLLPNGDHSASAQLKRQTMRTIRDQPLISASGLYTIKTVSTEFCEGEVLEPTSCLLQNPPEPELSIESENIVDKCAGNPIGLRVGLDFVGTPPFYVKYIEQRDGERPSSPKLLDIETLRSTIELTPTEAGHFTYIFQSISDSVYSERSLHDLKLVQDVRPSASAFFAEPNRPKQACIDDFVEFNVHLVGDGPFKLEYELVHNGKRNRETIKVEGDEHRIVTPSLKNGGEYTISLASITDKMGCKELLKADAKVNVRHERPKAYFGLIDGKQDVMALQGKSVELPLRLTGTGPWSLAYENLDTQEKKNIRIGQANSKLPAKAEGTYRLLEVRDSVCPGFIDEKANQFSVGWIARPQLSIPESAYKRLEGGKHIREEVCEGDEDSFDVSLNGNAPYDLWYEQRFRDAKHGRAAAPRKKDLRALGGTASIRAETSQSGTYEYKFVQLADSKYDHSSAHFSPITVEQTVNPRPNARFDKPGKTYGYCSREAGGEEVIPLTLEGVPPFYLEVEIKHHGTPKPETSYHKSIPTNKYDLKIEHRKLQLGHSAVSIKKVRDGRGCTQKLPPGGPRVQISVHDAPTVTPMEDRTDFCVGDRLSFALGGQVPFTVFYTFEKKERKASNTGTTFRRLAELPGTFTITGLLDAASECRATVNLTKQIHPIPSVRLSGGQVSEVDIHEGGVSDLEFQFWGTPPFEFTYTRSTNAQKSRKSKVLEMKTEVSHEHRLSIPVQEEGTYEVVSIKDRWCSFAKPIEGLESPKGKGQKLLQY